MTSKVDLSKLSKEEKLELLSLLEERERRAKERRAVYTPNEGQLPVHQSDATIKFVASGNGAGKTCAAVHEVMWAAMGFHPVKARHTKVPCDVAVVLDKPDKADSVWVKEIQRWFVLKADQLHKRGKPNTTVISFDNGSTITFHSHEQDPLTFESTQYDYVAYDEPPPEPLFIALRRSTRKKGSKPWHLIIGTPLAQPWLRQKIWEPWSKGELKEAECFRMASAVNKGNINWEEQEKNFSFMTEKERAIREKGEFFDLEGLALAHLFKKSTHVVKSSDFSWEQSNPVVVAIDPHPAKKHFAVMLGVDRDNYLYALREMAVKAIPRDFARQLKEWMRGYRVIDIVCDSLGSSEYTGGEGFKSFIQVLREEGVQVRPTTFDEKSDEDFIARMQDVLRLPDEPNNFGQLTPKLRIVDCPQLIRDIENVCFQRDKIRNEYKPKLEISNRDMLATLKYALATNLFYAKPNKRAYYPSKPLYGIARPPGPSTAALRLKLGLKRR